jgi:hypothetical protein
VARPAEGEAKPRWPWTEGLSAPAGPAGTPSAVVEEPAEPAPRHRRLWRGARRVAEPEGVTWLGESQVVKALEEAEARAVRRHRPAEIPAPAAVETAVSPPEIDDPGEPTAPVPMVAAAGAGADETDQGAPEDDEPAGPLVVDAAGAVAGAPDRRPQRLRRKKAPRGASSLEAAGAAAVAASPVEHPVSQEQMVTDTATQEQAAAEDLAAPPRRHIGWLGSKEVAAAVALILAVEVGYIVHLNTSSSSVTTRPPQALPALHVPPQAPTLPSASLPVTPPSTAPAPATKAASAPATTVPAHAAAAVVPDTAAPPPQPCTAGDLSFSTATDRASYGSGEPVIIVTKVTDVTSCVFTPTAPPGSSCPTSISVDYAGGGAAPMGQESCTPPAATTMNPGATETVTATLPAGELSPGAYTAVGTWGWQAGQGVSTSRPASATFTVSS